MFNLRTGALGRSLVAIRDSEEGARSVGVDVRVLKVLIFTVSAMLAGLGGALLAQQAQAFDPDTFDPLAASLPWFAVVVVFGADSAVAAVVGAAFIVGVNALTGQDNAYSSYRPARGVPRPAAGRRCRARPPAATEWAMTPESLMRRYAETAPPPRAEPVLSDRGRAALDRVRAHRPDESVGSA